MKLQIILVINLFFLSTFCFAESRKGYTARAAKVQTNGDLCIFEFGTNVAGTIGNCSTDKVKPKDIDALNKKIDAFFTDKPKSLLNNFLKSRKKESSGGFKFSLSDFNSFLDSTKGGSCGSALRVYKQRKRELDASIKRLNESFESNEDSLLSSCKPANSKAEQTKTIPRR